MIVMIGFKYKPLQRIKTDRLKYYLWDHPDRELVGYLLDGYTNRFKLGRTRRPKNQGPCQNSREVQRHPNETQELVDKEVALGHILDPFDYELYKDMVYSPLNIVLKPTEAGQKQKWRLIHDLAYPYCRMMKMKGMVKVTCGFIPKKIQWHIHTGWWSLFN